MPNHKEISRASIVITGLARDVANVIESEILHLQSAFSDFKKVSFFIVESDSIDGTVEQLSKLALRVENFRFLSLGNLQEELPERIARLAHCRQICADFVNSQVHDYVVVSDLDGTNSLLTSDAIRSCWMQVNWDVCLANQKGHYYDIYALRHCEWSKQDYNLDIALFESAGIHPMKARRKAVLKKQRKILPNSDWIEVDSAFGGLAIYTSKSFSIGKYDYVDSKTGKIVCEHVPFHENIIANGGRLFINPRLINHEVRRYKSVRSFLRYTAQYFISMISPNLFRFWEQSRSTNSNFKILTNIFARNSQDMEC